MTFSISRVAFRYRRVVMMIVSALMLFGAFSYFSLPALEDPPILIREAIVTTRFPGMPAERVEALITTTLEEAVREVPEVDEVSSFSTEGQSILHVKVDDRFFDLDGIWREVRERISDVQSALPEGTPPPDINDDFGDVAVITAALTGPQFSPGELFDAAKAVRDQLFHVPGTKKIELAGVQPERVYVEVDPARLAATGLSRAAIATALSQQNIEVPVGELTLDARTFAVETSGDLPSVRAVREVLVQTASGALLPLSEVATVRRGVADPMAPTSYYNGEPSITLAVSMLEGYRVLDYAPAMRAAMDEVRQELPAGLELSLISYQAEPVEEAVHGVTLNVGQTLAIVLGVVILFLGVRTGLIVGAIVPVVMLITLAVMGATEMPLERMSLATLVIALGLLVDNGVVIAEDFKTRMAAGADRWNAMVETGRELALPLLSSTATTVLFFMPLMLAEHASGEYTRSISLVILISLTASWFIALTVTPVLCYLFIGDGTAEAGRAERAFQRLGHGYERVLRWVMGHRLIFGAVILALFMGAGAAMQIVPKKFFPDSDRREVLAYIDLPTDASMETTDARLRSIMADLENADFMAHVDDYVAYVGFGGPRFVLSLTPIDPAPNKAFVVLNVHDGAHKDDVVQGFRELLATGYDDVEARVTTMFLGPSDSRILEVQVRGPDAGVLLDTAERVEAIFRDVEGTIDVHHSWESTRPRLIVDVDQTSARRAGVTSAAVARTLRAHLVGEPISALREGDDIVPIVLRSEAGLRTSPEHFEALAIEGPEGVVSLAQVAEVRHGSRLGRIQRENMVRTVAVEGLNTLMAAEDMLPRVQAQLDALETELPAGHTLVVDGVIAESLEGQAALSTNVPLCLALIVVLLVAQFNSFRRAGVILLTIPLVFVGAVVGLLVVKETFGFMVILGLYSLAGIIINNAIVLVDRIEIEREQEGVEPYEAIVAACTRRLRPILMTTVTTILGLLPLIIGRDVLFSGMSAAIAFGLALGTVFTLGVVPVLYALFFRIRTAP